MTIRWLSISLIFRCATSARRAPGGVEGHQQDAMKGQLRRVDQTCYFFRTEYLRQVQNFLRVWRFGNAPTSF